MGNNKKGSPSSSSWLTAVKRAFRSPIKDPQKKKQIKTRNEISEVDEDEEEKVGTNLASFFSLS